ncbi:hypothetical protein BT96DRAFT_1103169 [Gymnopus androsaceus JB14]|uniref:Uncharacterized protein n=1 Tax=Gymnopus androsaceus JB14 TaxID=1447944 RepID=A0A6A4I8D7_9AGAR|nr:hypothetical protein BT96DRAFT_1103169 [Gymnopus androsaceus JB14]
MTTLSRTDILANLTATPRCFGMQEESSSSSEREKFQTVLMCIHLAYGLAYTVGSALGSIPPSTDLCLTAFTAPNKPSEGDETDPTPNTNRKKKKKQPVPSGWWGTPSGPVAVINEKALTLFWKITNTVTWRNLHWLPHSILVYEIRVQEGYGMRWSQDQSEGAGTGVEMPPWIFRGFVEPMMENGHEFGWRHAP